MTSDASDVIDWVEAMEQCGDDEDFLRELLDDLRGEVAAQIQKIENTLKVRSGRGGEELRCLSCQVTGQLCYGIIILFLCLLPCVFLRDQIVLITISIFKGLVT